MVIMTANGKDYMLYRDTLTGLLIAGEGAFLFNDNIREVFKGCVEFAKDVVEIQIDTRAYVQYEQFNHEHKFYAQDARLLPQVMNLLIPGYRPVLVTQVEYFRYLLDQEKKANPEQEAQ